MEIKFRVWDKKNHIMDYIDDLCWFEHEGIHNYRGHGLLCDYEIMQFTGIHDKNGKEIYDGDIVLTQEYSDRPYSKKMKCKRHIGVVEYKIYGGNGFYNHDTLKHDKRKEYGAGWTVKIKDYCGFACRSWGEFYDCEVIGNIYENPELKLKLDVSQEEHSGSMSLTKDG